MKKFNKLYNTIKEGISNIINIPCKFGNFYIEYSDEINLDTLEHHCGDIIQNRCKTTKDVLFKLVQSGLNNFETLSDYKSYRMDGQSNEFTILSKSTPEMKIKINISKKNNKRYKTIFNVKIRTVLTQIMKDHPNDVPIEVESVDNDVLNADGYFDGTIPLYVD